MSALFVVVPLALIVSAAAVGAFVWSVRRGQMDDLETPALRMLADEQEASSPTETADQGLGVEPPRAGEPPTAE